MFFILGMAQINDAEVPLFKSQGPCTRRIALRWNILAVEKKGKKLGGDAATGSIFTRNHGAQSFLS
jgi:hypothetical protein